MNNLLFADGKVGLEICQWALTEYRQDFCAVVTTGDLHIHAVADAAGVPCVKYVDESELIRWVRQNNLNVDWGFLVWWPSIIRPALIELPQNGFINTHPSLLPYNRGKHYNFWALVERAPFGVSLHFVEPGIDCGDVVAQLPIPYGWEDNGETLYQKAVLAMVELFKESYPMIRVGNISRSPQNIDQGSFHFAKELDEASRIELDKNYTASSLLNLLRARTFQGHPACWFEDGDGSVYEVRVEIRRKTP